MRSALLRSSVVVATAALTLTACAGAPPTTATTTTAQAGAAVAPAEAEPTPEPSPEPSQDAAGTSDDDLLIADGGESGTLEVPSYTNILLETARSSLELRGFTVEAVDSTGQSRMVDDEDQWVVVSQDPPAGVVIEGAIVVLGVAHRDEIRG